MGRVPSFLSNQPTSNLNSRGGNQSSGKRSSSGWFEFKENWYDANGIGEYISSLSNTAALLGKENAYLVWGVNNDTHKLTNTTFDFHKNVKIALISVKNMV